VQAFTNFLTVFRRGAIDIAVWLAETRRDVSKYDTTDHHGVVRELLRKLKTRLISLLYIRLLPYYLAERVDCFALGFVPDADEDNDNLPIPAVVYLVED
jgi:hypothetical protein